MTHARQKRSNVSAALMAVCAAGLGAILGNVPAASQTAGEMKTFENAQYKFSVALPAGCHHNEGPGTVDAICSDDLDPERSATASKLNALVLQVSAETLTGDASRGPGELAQDYPEAAFKAELPEAVCGEAIAERAKVENVKSALEAQQVVYTADIGCAEVRFLRVARRKATVRYLVGPAARYRLMARAAADDFERHKAVIDGFFASFNATEK
jgi:hypothetical protein